LHYIITDVTIIEIEIVFLTEHRIESKSYFSCILSNDLSIEALDRLLTPSRFNASTTDCSRGGRRVVVGNYAIHLSSTAAARLEWERGDRWGGRTGVVPGQTRPTYRYRPIITWHWPESERWLRIFLTV